MPTLSQVSAAKKESLMMATFKVETISHPTNGRVAANIYYPTDPDTLLVGTDYTYSSHEAAEADVMNIIRKAFPDQSVNKRS